MVLFGFPLRSRFRLQAAYGSLERPDVRRWAAEGMRVEYTPGHPLESLGGTSHLGLALLTPLREGTYRISSPYGYRISPISGTRKFHNGLDMAAPTGTPIYASADGRVNKRYYENTTRGRVNGNALIIAHDEGFRTAYLHMSKVFVSEGDTVKQGQVIGEVGSTGQSTGPHLHFIVYRGGYATGDTVDPAKWISASVRRSSRAKRLVKGSKGKRSPALAAGVSLGVTLLIGALLFTIRGRRRRRRRPADRMPAESGLLTNPRRRSRRRRRYRYPIRPNG